MAIAAKEGNYALVGGPANNEGVGAAWTFFRESGKTTWAQQAKLTGGGESGPGYFGVSVALSATGEYALMGGDKDNAEVGAAWVFLANRENDLDPAGRKAHRQGRGARRRIQRQRRLRLQRGDLRRKRRIRADRRPQRQRQSGRGVGVPRTGTTWTQQGPKLTGKEETGAGQFGWSVALSEKGEYAVIGGPSDNEYAGAAWVFTRSGTTWTQQGPKLTGKEESGKAYFGWSVALAAKKATTR